MSSAPLDQVHRDRAITELDASAFLAAGAGTGKTSTLVDRLIETIRRGTDVRSIVAITFTELAGAELRHRLRAELEKACAKPDANDSLRLALAHVDAAMVGTIHSFAQQILRRFALEAGLPIGFVVAGDAQKSAAETLRRRIAIERVEGMPEYEVATRAYRASVGRLLTIVELLDDNLLRIKDWSFAEGDRLDLLAQVELLKSDLEQFKRDASAVCTDDTDLLYVAIMDNVPLVLEILEAADPTAYADQLRADAAKGRKKPGFFMVRGGKNGAWDNDVESWKQAWEQLAERTRGAFCVPLEIALRTMAVTWCESLAGERTVRVQQGELEFDDLLWLCADVLQRDQAVRARLHSEIQVMLIDEFQDTDPLQWEIIRRITADPDDEVAMPLPGRIVVVGDPKQAIYSFRGADVRTYEAAETLFSDTTQPLGNVLPLTANFRTVLPLVEWVNEVFASAMTAPTQVKYESLQPVHDPEHPEPGPHIVTLADPPAWVANKEPEFPPKVIESKLAAQAIRNAIVEGWQITERTDDRKRVYKRPCSFRDVAILFPTRTSLDVLMNELDAWGIPYRSSDVRLVLDRPAVIGVVAALTYIADVENDLQLWLALKSPLFGCSESDLLQYRLRKGRWSGMVDDELLDNRAAGAIALLNRIRAMQRTAQPVQVIDAICDSTRIFEVLARTPRGNFDADCLRMLRAHAVAWQEAGGVGLGDYMDEVRLMLAEGSRAQLPSPDDRDDDAVRLMTTFGAKGLEFPIVVMAGMATKPKMSTDPVLVRDDGGLEFGLHDMTVGLNYPFWKELSKQRTEDERIRVHYVGATRARDHLVLSLCGESRKVASTGGGAALLRAHAKPATCHIDTIEEPVPFEVQPSDLGTPVALDWVDVLQQARARTSQAFVVSPSGVAASEALGRAATSAVTEEQEAPSIDEDDDSSRMTLMLRDGKSFGQAVHAAMDGIISGRFSTDAKGIQAAAASGAAVADGEVDIALVMQSITAALEAGVVKEALAAPRRWSELYLAAKVDSGSVELVEGVADLVFEDAQGNPVVVDYKTDLRITPERKAHYADQLGCYAEMLHRVSGKPVTRKVIVHVPGATATQFEV